MRSERHVRTLEGRTAIVTGSAQGIGQEIALGLGRAGAAVIGVDRSPQHGTTELMRQTGASWTSRSIDITEAESVLCLVTELEDGLGDVDILVNNAGVNDAVGFDELTYDRWRQIMSVNLDGAFLMISACVPMMRRRGYGRIINLGSGSVLNSMRGSIAYRASKMGVIGMTRALSTELGRDGITLNVVSPGVTATPMAEQGLSDEFRAKTIERQGVKRLGSPADIAGTVTFLASPEAAFITGQTILVNGGASFG
ncbi:MAG: SDR family NAD(P)-dependent oxidoreductase [Actinomycetales bacterium]